MIRRITPPLSQTQAGFFLVVVLVTDSIKPGMLDEFVMLISVLQVVEMEYRDHGERWSKKQKANLTHFSTISCLDEFCLCRTTALAHLSGARVPPQICHPLQGDKSARKEL